LLSRLKMEVVMEALCPEEDDLPVTMGADFGWTDFGFTAPPRGKEAIVVDLEDSLIHVGSNIHPQ
jgi:hypothetical protein